MWFGLVVQLVHICQVFGMASDLQLTLHGVASAASEGSGTESSVWFGQPDTGKSGECPGKICGEGNSKWFGGKGMPLNSRSELWQ
jgi:hypothetical protein